MSNWEFWIDVGGTFTDCLARGPAGQMRRYKLLSSGVTKGAAHVGSSSLAIVDPARRGDPPGFWDGWRLALVDADGTVVATSTVARFERAGSRLELAEPLAVTPQAHQPYELTSDDDAPLVAIRFLLGVRPGEPLPPVTVRLGTTRGTNALLTRRGARTAWITTRGFGDALAIGYQNRPRLFELDIHKPEPLYAAVVEIDERVAADGTVLLPLDPDTVRRQLAALRDAQIESLAICLLHAPKRPAHEQQVANLARELGFRHVSTSSEVAPLVKIVARGDTTVVDAYLTPVLRDYVDRLREPLRGGCLRLMTSAGGLVDAASFRGKDSILSGPAGGVVGFSRVAQAAGQRRAIGFDMGGTSTDVSRFDGHFEREYETEKAGVRIVAPMLAIETVAAGGGSICGFDGVKLTVGPASAGADPGPACYGRGGPLSVTDLNFYLGRILAERFAFPLQRAAVERRLDELIAEVERATGRRYAPVELCTGLLRIANNNMVQAIRSVSVARGADPRDYVLVAFGGAAPQHACAVARELNMREVLIHDDASLLSAYGIGLADVVRHGVAGIYQPAGASTLQEATAQHQRLAAAATAELIAEAVPPEQIGVRRSLDLRYQGTEAALPISEPDDGDYPAAFAAEHRRRYGYVHAGRPIEIVAARVEVVGRSPQTLPPARPAPAYAARAERSVSVCFDGAWHETAVLNRADLQPGAQIVGPALLYQAHSTTIVEPGWVAEVLTGDQIRLTDAGTIAAPAVSTTADPVMLEIFNHQFAGIAERMGIALRNTAGSVNVKERLDFSCALFTAAGRLVVNAPHIPVHLGAMGETVRSVLADNPQLRAGDVFVTNDPYRGGSHLPDVTVVTPVHDAATGQLVFFTASRAHHAEIGGIRPGSMPPGSRNLAEEGVLIRNFRLVEAGRPRFDELRALLTGGPYPSRSVDENLADLAAQVAANQQGALDLARLIERYSLPVVTAYMRHIQAAAATKTRRSLARLEGRQCSFADQLDNGARIAVCIRIEHLRAMIDFTGTDGVLPDNLNANRAIVTAAVLYVLRALLDEDIPLNEGVLEPVELVLPTCLLNPLPGPTPATSPAVVGGNVETSQRVVDVLLGALGLAAASQGTMNNLLFGGAQFGYYETICGGAGATPHRPGADAVHTHMTNTRITDPEVLENRYPVQVVEFAIRRGSGGAGRFRGGDGARRRLRFLAPLAVSILSNRRPPFAPFGLAGGEPGASGRNVRIFTDGRHEELPGRAQYDAAPGEELLIETPGGGGYGRPE
ncbi:MAG: hydantoinase B/oxoprolinase family protein [Pirellulales bacterium]|nr:hydantoinase B/oxoprolinase family protein [Pirellulales bacterium]